VRCVDPRGREFARGIVSYSAAELDKIKGRHSRDIETALGYKMSDEVIHRDDLVRLDRAASEVAPPGGDVAQPATRHAKGDPS
jgi:glutamate 5-kinase